MAAQLIQWRPEYAVGVEEVDYEHQQMIALINELYADMRAAGDPDSTAAFLGEVYARMAAHFALEEKVMRERRYDRYHAHKDDHERLLDELRDLMDAYERSAALDEDELARRLDVWFTEHFKTQDARLHKRLG